MRTRWCGLSDAGSIDPLAHEEERHMTTPTAPVNHLALLEARVRRLEIQVRVGGAAFAAYLLCRPLWVVWRPYGPEIAIGIVTLAALAIPFGAAWKLGGRR